MSKFLELFKGRWVSFFLTSNESIPDMAGYLIDEDEMYYYMGYDNRIEISGLVKKDRVIYVNTNHKS